MGYQEHNFKQDTPKKLFNCKNHKNDTQLSNEEPVLVWKFLGQYQRYNVNTRRCLLCLNGKLQFVFL